MDECRKQFEEWFDSELLKFKDDNVMLRVVHRRYVNNWTGWQAAWNRRAKQVPEGYKLVPIKMLNALKASIKGNCYRGTEWEINTIDAMLNATQSKCWRIQNET